MYIGKHDHSIRTVLRVVLTTVSLTCEVATFSSFNVLASFNPERTVHHCLGVNLIVIEHFSRGTNRDFRELSGISVNDCYHFKIESERNTHGMVCSCLTKISMIFILPHSAVDILEGLIHTKVVNK